MNSKPVNPFFLSLLTSVFVICIACSKKHPAIPPQYIQPQEMVSILADIHIAQAAATSQLMHDSAKKSFTDFRPVIFKSHHTTAVLFDSSMNYYIGNPELLDSIYKEVIDELSRKQSEVQSQVNKLH